MGSRTFLLAVILVAFTVVVVIAVRRLPELLKSKQDDSSAKGESLISQIHGIWWMVGIAIGAVKYVYKAWQAAPLGSPAKFGWGALLALMAAVGVFAVVKLIDRKLNPPQTGDEIQTQRDTAPTTYTYGRMTDKWEYKR